MNRRGFLTGIIAACAAPALVRSGLIMPIKPGLIISGDGVPLMSMSHPRPVRVYPWAPGHPHEIHTYHAMESIYVGDMVTLDRNGFIRRAMPMDRVIAIAAETVT